MEIHEHHCVPLKLQCHIACSICWDRQMLSEISTRDSLDPEKKVREIKTSEQIHKEKEHLRNDAFSGAGNLET